MHILSSMESKDDRPSPDDLAGDLARAEAARDAFARKVTVPPGLLLWLGLGIAVQIAGAALVWLPYGFIFTIVGALTYVVIAVLLLRWFERVNGAKLGGFVSRVLGGTATSASVIYLMALAGALWAGYVGAWGVAAICAIAGGAGFAACGARWIRTYRAAPASNARGESTLVLVAMGIVAACGAVLLLVFR